jgi:hypothetical protein
MFDVLPRWLPPQSGKVLIVGRRQCGRSTLARKLAAGKPTLVCPGMNVHKESSDTLVVEGIPPAVSRLMQPGSVLILDDGCLLDPHRLPAEEPPCLILKCASVIHRDDVVDAIILGSGVYEGQHAAAATKAKELASDGMWLVWDCRQQRYAFYD